MVRSPVTGATPRGTVRESPVKSHDKQYFAVEQGTHNLQLKSLLLENQDQQAAFCTIQVETAQDALRNLRTRHADGIQRLVEFGKGYKFTGAGEPSGGAEVVRRCNLHTPYDIFARKNTGAAVKTFAYSALLDAAVIEAETNIAMRTEAGDSEGDDVFNISHEARSEATPTKATGDRPHITHRTAMQARDGESFKSLPHYFVNEECESLKQLVQTHIEMMGIDALEFVRDELSRSRFGLHSHQMKLASKQEEQDLAVRMRDIGKADLAMCDCVDILEDMVALVHDRVRHTNNGSDDAGSFNNMYALHKEKAKTFLDKLQAHNDTMDSDIAFDTDAMVMYRMEEMKKHTEATDGYWRDQDESLSVIEGHHTEQVKLWEEIIRMVKEVGRIGEQKAEEVARYTARKEAEERRIRHHNEFIVALDTHAHELNKLRENIHVSQHIVKETQQFFDKGCALIEERNVEDELTRIRERELKLYLEIYRQYALVMGDLILKRRTRLQGVRRLMRNQEAQLELCLDSFDPLEDHYKQELDALNVTEREVSAKLDGLMRRAKRREDLYEPIERELDERDFDFMPPKISLGEFEQEKRDRLLDHNKSLISKEQDEMAKEVVEIRKLNSTVVTGRDMMNNRREERKSRLKTLEPVSPSRPMSAMTAVSTSARRSPASQPASDHPALSAHAERALPPLSEQMDAQPMAHCP